MRMAILAAVLLLSAPIGLAAAAEPADSGELHPEDATTPVSASANGDDLAVTAQIRRALAADDSLSLLAKHIRVATNADAVVLRGPVRAQEPDKIENEVRQYAGARQVINQLTVDDRP